MTIYLPSHLSTRAVAHEPRLAISSRSEESSRHVIQTVQKVLSPIENPVCRERHPVAPLGLYPRVNVYEIERTGAGVSNHAKVVSDRKQRVERSQCVCLWSITAGNISLYAEPRLKPPRGDCVTVV